MTVLVKYGDESPEENWNCAKSTISFNDEVISNKLANVLNVSPNATFFSAMLNVGRDRLSHILTFIIAEQRMYGMSSDPTEIVLAQRKCGRTIGIRIDN